MRAKCELFGNKIKATGNTYPFRIMLKNLGFKWNPQERAWELNILGKSDDDVRKIVYELYKNGFNIGRVLLTEYFWESEWKIDVVNGHTKLILNPKF